MIAPMVPMVPMEAVVARREGVHLEEAHQEGARQDLVHRGYVDALSLNVFLSERVIGSTFCS